MFCHNCGMENSEDSNHCSSCGEQLKVKVLNPEALKVDLLKENSNTINTNSQEPKEVIANQQVRSPLVWSILVTVFGFFTCCIPVSLVVGIIAIVFSSRVEQKQRLGDYIGAKNDAKTATILNWVGFGFLVLAIILIGLIFFIGAISSNEVTQNI